MLGDVLILLGLIVLNGMFSLAEIAIISVRPARLKPFAGKSRGARAALHLVARPGRFFSTVQIGITLIGIISGAFAGDTLGKPLALWLVEQGVSAQWAGTLGVGGVVVVVTYVSLIIGELVPKQLALRNPPRMAMRVAPLMMALSVLVAPMVWVLDHSAAAILRLLGVHGPGNRKLTEEELKSVLLEAQEGGILESEERVMMAGVMRLSDRTARNLMTPRQEVEAIPVTASSTEVIAAARRIARARMPVKDESGDIIGIVLLADIFQAVSRRDAVDLGALVHDLPVVSDRMEALDVVQVLQKSGDHMALVYDEYGHFEGIITTADVLAAITGAIAAAQPDEPAVITRPDGALVVAGWMPADEFCDRMGLPRAVAGDYDTLAGLVLFQLGHLPALGEVITVDNCRFEVMALDGLRIAKVLVTRV